MCSLGNRFNRHAQLSKQAMLARLVEALQRQQLHSNAPEAHYSLLSAIIHLSRKPLQDDYVPSAAALACLQAGATGTMTCYNAIWLIGLHFKSCMPTYSGMDMGRLALNAI